MRLNSWGLWIVRGGEELCWIWPWKRTSDEPWFLVSIARYFYTLREVDQFFEDYNLALHGEYDKETGLADFDEELA